MSATTSLELASTNSRHNSPALAVVERLYTQPPSYVELVETSRWRVHYTLYWSTPSYA